MKSMKRPQLLIAIGLIVISLSIVMKHTFDFSDFVTKFGIFFRYWA